MLRPAGQEGRYKVCNINNYNETMRNYAEYIAIANQAKAEAEKLKNELIEFMTSENLDILQGNEHKATLKTIESNRFDTKVFKLDDPATYEKYCRKSTTTRFNFS